MSGYGWLHGSFLHILEYAEYFISIGYDVTIGSVYISPYNREIVEKRGINVFPVFQLPDVEYDIVYALHLIIFPALLLRGLKYKKAISMTLSAFLPIEMVPPIKFLPHFDMVNAISEEAVNSISRKFSIPNSMINVVPNHIPLNFVEMSHTKTEWNHAISRVAVVSNHSIDELKSLKEISTFKIDLIGKEYNNVKQITPELLLEYDALITIGKTVQYGLGLGIPVFEYDDYGGCGYITPENILDEEHFNFSGRKTRRKLTAEQILSELTQSYAQAVANAPILRELSLKRYSIDTLVQRQLEEITSRTLPHPKLKGDALLFANAAYASLSYMMGRRC